MENLNSLNKTKLIHATYRSDSNGKGKVLLTDGFKSTGKKTKKIPYDYEIGCTLKTAFAYLLSSGAQILTYGEDDLTSRYFFAVELPFSL